MLGLSAELASTELHFPGCWRILILQHISVSVVRRRAEIGIVRGLGAGRGVILYAFVGEAASLGLRALIGIPLAASWLLARFD